VVIDLKRSSAPAPGKGFLAASEQLQITDRRVFCPGTERLRLRKRQQAVGFSCSKRLQSCAGSHP